MKSTLIQAATFLSTLASASIASSPSTPPDSAKDITTVAGTTGPDHLSIHFSAPCQGCFIGTDDGLELTLEIDSADEECTSSPPRLNGLPLVANNGNDGTRGQLSFKSKPSNGLGEKEVHAFWESTCLKGEASILSVRFDDIVGNSQVKGSSGFTTSFKQKGQPTVLRLQDRPIEKISDDEDTCATWLRPDHSSKLSVAPISLDSHTADELLEVQYAKLTTLQSQIQELHEQFRTTEGTIMSLLKDEFKSCSSLKCLWDTAKSKAPGICKLIKSHFSHHTGSVSGCTDGDAQSPCTTEEQDVPPVQQDGLEPTESIVDLEETKVEPTSTSLLPSPAPSPSDEKTEGSHSPSTESEDHSNVHPSVEDDSAHPPSRPAHGPPPGFPHHFPPGHDGPPSGFPHHFPPGHDGPPPWFHPHETPENGPSGLAPFDSTSNSVQRTIRHHLVLAIISLIILALVGGLIFRTIQICRDPRRRAECAARREEHRTKMLYRKAARRHRLRTWWKKCRRQVIGDYEEKREIILEQEGISEDSLQNDIQTLRTATDLVRNLVDAEEGRAQIDYRALPARYQANYQSPYASPDYDAGIGSSRLSDSLPAYVAPPPRYEEELEGDLTVVDGFIYTPSTSDDATESSIVDCSPRLSFETGRSTILTRDARD